MDGNWIKSFCKETVVHLRIQMINVQRVLYQTRFFYDKSSECYDRQDSLTALS